MSSATLCATLRALQRHLAALPCLRYELRLIDQDTRQCCASRWWSSEQLVSPCIIAFLRARNREGCDIYFRPYAGAWNAGYVLLDFDAAVCPLARMRAAGHAPCVLLETSPGRQQVWVRIGLHPVEPATATATAHSLAATYGADPASADWRHLGRLAGFTNRKPRHRNHAGLPPFVRVLWTGDPGVAVLHRTLDHLDCVQPRTVVLAGHPAPRVLQPGAYAQWLQHAGVWLPITDWSAADYRVARALLAAGLTAAQAMAVLRSGSPGFPRRHADPEDYLWRTVSRAADHLDRGTAFSGAPVE